MGGRGAETFLQLGGPRGLFEGLEDEQKPPAIEGARRAKSQEREGLAEGTAEAKARRRERGTALRGKERRQPCRSVLSPRW